jgi:hypothetical protein
VLGGLTYTSETVGSGDTTASKIHYDFYVHAYGSVTAFGFISVGVDFYLTLTIYQGASSYSEGKVDVSYSVKIGFFKKSFTLTYSRRFSGSGGGAAAVAADKAGHAIAAAKHPATLQEFVSFDDWVAYRRAFAA